MFRLAIVCALAVCTFGASVPESWKRLDGRIVGGHDTSIDKHPHQVSLLYSSHNCGGSLIAKNWVLTAAHCIGVNKYNVRVGSSIVNSGGILHKVKNHYRHPKYNAAAIDFDYALLELETPVQLTNDVSIIKLVDEGVDLKPGTLLTVTGWGSTGNGPATNVLQEVQVPHVDQTTCSKSYPGSLTDRMFCAGYLGQGGKDSCQGDSGGPVVVNGVQHGIVSWGRGCALPDYPGVYSKISTARSWIKEVSGV